jgi:F-type H+-transporting ATPase subunit epsilon
MPVTDQTYFDLIIVSPDATVFEGQVIKLIAPGYNQDIAILPNHTPLYAQLNQGELLITTPDGYQKKIPIDGGIIRVKLNRVSVIIGFDILRH